MDIIGKIFVVENVTCIFRNFSSFKTKGRIFAIVCTSLELVILINNIYRSFDSATSIDALFISSFTMLSRSNSILIIVLGLKNAKAYKVLYFHVNAAYVKIKNCKKIKTSLKKLKIYSMLIISFFLINDTIMIVRFVCDFLPIIMAKKGSQLEVIIFASEALHFLLSEYRYFIELVLLIVYINIVSLALNFLNYTIVKASKMLEDAELESEVACELKKNIAKFDTVAIHVFACSNQLSKVFGIQIVYALFSATIYFIFLLYKGIHSLISHEERNRFGSGNSILLLCNYITVPMLTMHAGQKAQNEADRVTRALARLHNTLLINHGDGAAELKKTVMDLHRRMSVNPIRIKMVSEVLHMPMLPDIVNAVVSYTIVFLQFNHVL